MAQFQKAVNKEDITKMEAMKDKFKTKEPEPESDPKEPENDQ